MAAAKTRKNTFFAWISIKQMNELALFGRPAVSIDRIAPRRR
jgi:hypothetical protein